MLVSARLEMWLRNKQFCEGSYEAFDCSALLIRPIMRELLRVWASLLVKEEVAERWVEQADSGILIFWNI
jgi:hypothetical protein